MMAVAASAQAQLQRPLSFEVRGIAMVPTFDIADAADVGPGFGFGIGVQLSPVVRLMADFDAGFHGTPSPSSDINTYHAIGKVGLDVVRSGRVTLTLNAGAGAVRFAGDLPEAKTYFAINAGAKLGIRVTEAVELLASPQGDIAFSKEDDLGTNNSWVWPLGVGLRLRF